MSFGPFKLIFGICMFALVFAASQPGGFKYVAWLYGYERDEDGQFKGATRASKLAIAYRNRSDIDDMFNTSRLNNKRFVRAEIEIPFEDILFKGELRPDPRYYDVYATARAAAHLVELCHDVISALAVECGVSQSNGVFQKGGLVKLSGWLHFIPADAPGALSKAEGAKILDVRVDLTPDGPVPFTSQSRRALFNLARQHCAAVRAATGNCVVSSVYFGTHSRNGDALVSKEVTAHAKLTTYADEPQFGNDRLKLVIEKAGF